ncbi:hypothetical protein QP775_19430 [Paenibacillus sp. UMB4589-SE434]|nr:hypothetical protein [Paenibacillus sp. UMB4589-SE434]
MKPIGLENAMAPADLFTRTLHVLKSDLTINLYNELVKPKIVGGVTVEQICT